MDNTLYITFKQSITGGTTNVQPSVPYAIDSNGTYYFTVTGIVNGKIYTKEVSVIVDQFNDRYEYASKIQKKLTLMGKYGFRKDLRSQMIHQKTCKGKLL